MDSRGPIDGQQGRQTRSNRRSTATPYRPQRKRRSGGMAIAVTAVVVIVIVAFLGVRLGVSRLFRPASAATTAGTATTASGTKSATTASGSVQKSSATPNTATASTAQGAQPAWRTADPSWMKKYLGLEIDGFKTDSGYKAVALTFDDGPNGETAYVINTLKKYGGQATFFDTGRKLAMSWAKSQPTLIERSGFELGDHTQHHTINNVSSMWHRTSAVDLAEINGPDAIIKSYGGQPTTWLRPMGGMIDATGIKAAVATNHLVINWTIDSNDSHGGPRTPDYIYTQVTSNIRSGDVVLMHVTHPESMAALPRICATLSKAGYKLVTLSELAQHSTAAITQPIKN